MSRGFGAIESGTREGMDVDTLLIEVLYRHAVRQGEEDENAHKR
jgi:hypothetical protein